MKWGKKVEFTLEYERDSNGIPIYKKKNKKTVKDKKLSSYQKLKNENAELRRMLSVVCLHPESHEAWEIKMSEMLKMEYNQSLKISLNNQLESAKQAATHDVLKVSILPNLYQIKPE